MRPWMVVILLVVAALVALSVAGLSVTGAGRPDFEGLKGLPRVAAEDLSAKAEGCPSGFTGACEVAIAPAGRWLRKLEISTIDQVEVRFTPASTDQPMTIKLTGSFKQKSVDLAVDRQGGRLELRCVRVHPAKVPPACGVALR